MTMLHSMNQTITDMGREITSIREQLRPMTIAEDVISAVQSSITTTTKELHSATHTSTECFIRHLMQHVQSYSWDIGTICHELNSSHLYSRSVLQDLVDRYDATAVGSYDGTIAFGNELVMLRLAVTACAERINLLLADHPNIPRVPLGDAAPMSPTTATQAMEVIHNDYMSGLDLTSMVTVTDDPTQLNRLRDTLTETQASTTTETGAHSLDLPMARPPSHPPSTPTPTFPTDMDVPGRPRSPNSHVNAEPTTTATESEAQSPTTSVQDSLSTSVLLGLATRDAHSDNNATTPVATTEPIPPTSASATHPDNTLHTSSSPPSTPEGILPTSSSSTPPDTSDSEENLITQTQPSGTPSPCPPREAITRRSRSRSGSTSESGGSLYSLHTAKSTSRAKRRRPRRRSYSPSASTSTNINSSLPTATPRSRSTQPTLHQFITKSRPRRTNANY
jgi:hypothetical protein